MTRVIAKTEPPPPSLLALIARAASDPSVDIEKMRALLDMQREIIADDARRQFNEAFVRLQPRLPRVKKNGTLEYPKDPKNPDGQKRKISTFMKFEDIDEAVRPILNEEGFSQSWTTTARSGDGGGLIVIHILSHEAGHSKETSMPIPLDTSGGKNNLQAYGSSLKYGQRYTMCAGLNIVAEGEDDDGMRGGARPITEVQIGELTKLIHETKSDMDAFLRFMDVETLADIQVDDCPKAINALMAKKRKAQNPAASPGPPAQPPANPAPTPSGARDEGVPTPPEAALSFVVQPVLRVGGGLKSWRATKDALIARAKRIANPDDFDRLRHESHDTIELLRSGSKQLWLDWNFESGQMEQELREKVRV